MNDFEESFDDDWAEKDYLTSLNHLYEVANNGGNSIYVLEGLLSVTGLYLECANIKSQKEIHAEIIRKFTILKHYTKDVVLKSKIETFDHAMAIGQFVELLISHGLPRLHSIEASAKLLGLGKSTVRIHNENFRKVFGHMENKGLKLIGYIKIMNERIKDATHLPSDHVKSKIAFNKTKAYYDERIALVEKMFPNIDEILKSTI